MFPRFFLKDISLLSSVQTWSAMTNSTKGQTVTSCHPHSPPGTIHELVLALCKNLKLINNKLGQFLDSTLSLSKNIKKETFQLWVGFFCPLGVCLFLNNMARHQKF